MRTPKRIRACSSVNEKWQTGGRVMTKSNQRIFIVGLCALIVLTGLVLFSSAASLLPRRTLAQRSQSNSAPQQPNKPKQAQHQDAARALQEFKARFPTTDYDSPEPTDPVEKAKRSKRNKHYDTRRLVMRNPGNSTTGVTEDSEVDIPALPVAQSDVILTADVLNSEAHLSNNKTAVYSEFNVQVDAVLKGAVPTLSQTNLISVSRLGGMVRYPSGQNVLYSIAHENMPAIGKRYLFFLKATEDPQAYEIVTGYEIGPERVLPLDWGWRVEAFSGTDSSVFLKTVRDAIANKN